jgi:hypothetical protein
MTAVSGQQQPPSLDGPVAKVRRANFHFTEVVEAWDKIGRGFNARPDAYSVEIGNDGCKHTYRAGSLFPGADPSGDSFSAMPYTTSEVRSIISPGNSFSPTAGSPLAERSSLS